MRLRVIDIETTGDAPPAEIIEFGRVDLATESGAWRLERSMARLYRPLNGIPAETMAVHHITEDQIDAEAAVCTEDKLRQAVWSGKRPDILVAHNCSFEQAFIPEPITESLPWICTYKSALRAWPQAPRHSNQALRYWRGLKLDPSLAMPPHRAGPDSYVTACVLLDLLKTVRVEEMVAWTLEPRRLQAIPFGKHRGLKWGEAPLDYLQWVVGQTDMDPDVAWNARGEIDRRKESQTA